MPYISHPHHRQKAYAAQKSQWLITVPEEEQCYQAATVLNWQCSGAYWGLHIINRAIHPLGKPPAPLEFSLHIAKFVGDENGNWHGYPVAPWLSPFDKPGEQLLLRWVGEGYIARAKMAKIHRGKKCIL